MANGLMVGLLVPLGLGAWPLGAQKPNPVAQILTSTETFPSGFVSERADRGECDLALRTLDERARAVLDGSPTRFANLAVRPKIKALHEVIDSWAQTFLLTNRQDFLTSVEGTRQVDTFLRRSRLLTAEPMMKLRPYATELLVMAAKLEVVSTLAMRWDIAHLNARQNLLERIVRFETEDTVTNHALRALVYSQLAFLWVVSPIDKTSADSRSVDVKRAASHLGRAAAEDARGLAVNHHAEFALIVLPHIVKAYVGSIGMDRVLLDQEVDEVVDVLDAGARGLIAIDGAGERWALDRVSKKLVGLMTTQARFVAEVPGLTDRLYAVGASITAAGRRDVPTAH